MITLQVLNAHGNRRAPRKVLMQAVHAALRGEGVRDAAIGIICLNDRQCRRLNRKHLGHDYATDVISFPLEKSPVLEGEVYVNLDRARQQARDFGVSPLHELARLAIHGTLHLTGCDDRTPSLAARMHAREDRYLVRLFGGHAHTGTS
jgi:probable rRNA maturation factor